MIGQVINNYRLEKKLGEGGMGEVFLARHNRIDRVVAIKILHKNLFTNESVRDRFKNEANALIKLDHPGIVKIFDYVEQEDLACLIVEYIDGMTLDEIINKRSGPFPDLKATEIICRVLDAVQYAHNNDIFHRDIKPGNIMVDANGHMTKVMDFGIAKFTGRISNAITQINTILGTPYYMSPEQVKGLSYSALSDIYSLGVTLFEMATGKCPYIGVNTLFELHSKIISEPLPPTNSYYPDVSPRLQQAIKIATEKIPENRFRSCEEFKQFILLKEEPAPFLKVRKKPREASLETNSFARKRKKRWVPLATLGMLIAIGVSYYMFFGKNNDNDTQKIAGKKDSTELSISPPSIQTVSKIDSSRLGNASDSIIWEWENNVHHKLANNQNKIEIRNSLIAVLQLSFNQTSIDSVRKIFDRYFKTQAQIISTAVVPPFQSQVMFDLSAHNLSNGNSFPLNTKPISYTQGQAGEMFTAQITFKSEGKDTVYKADVIYRRGTDHYEYVSNKCVIISIPTAKIASPYPDNTQITRDLTNYLKTQGRICNMPINNVNEIIGIQIGSMESFPKFSTITYVVEFSVRGTQQKCKINYIRNPEDDMYTYKKTSPICDQ